MSVFDDLVDHALRNQQELMALRNVVEKEILHHDILREMAAADLLQQLTFIGGTCLRACYGSNRLSEDLDFTGGTDFDPSQLSQLKQTLEGRLQQKYQLPISVSEPKATKQGNVDTWKLRVNTRPERPDLPAQRIHIDICAVPSYQPMPRTLRSAYAIDLGTETLIVNAQSREEIFVDKLVAFGMRPGRLKYRDIWDIAWLTQNGITPALELLESKLADHDHSTNEFLSRTGKRLSDLDSSEHKQAFRFEIARFISPERLAETLRQDGFWTYLIHTVTEQVRQAQAYLGNPPSPDDEPQFRM